MNKIRLYIFFRTIWFFIQLIGFVFLSYMIYKESGVFTSITVFMICFYLLIQDFFILKPQKLPFKLRQFFNK